MGSVRVLTVDDHATFRNAARALIGATDGFELAGEASTGEEGVAAGRRAVRCNRPRRTLGGPARCTENAT